MSSEAQLVFGFLQNYDDAHLGTIDGLFPKQWISRRYYATAREALNDMSRVFPFIDCIDRMYIVEHPVPVGFEQHWPHATYWQISLDKPFYGKVVGAYYYGKPNYYLYQSGTEFFEEGESPEEIKRKQDRAMQNFQEEVNNGRDRNKIMDKSRVQSSASGRC
jgi:hypothetical protein